MIVLDANILIYSYDSGSSQHTKARTWVEKTFSGLESVGLSWQTVAAFLRVMTNTRLPGPRLSLEQAARLIHEWLEQPNVRVLSPGDEHWILLRRMIVEGQASGALINDAQLAALTMEYGGVLHTTDRDFAAVSRPPLDQPAGLGQRRYSCIKLNCFLRICNLYVTITKGWSFAAI